jgi:hypothetical protein
MIHSPPGSAEQPGLAVAGKGLIDGSTRPEVEEVCRRPNAILRPRPDAVEDGCVVAVGVLVHNFVRKMNCFSDEIKADADFLLGDGILTGR